MPERPKPDLDQTREALRKHDAREKEDEEFEAEREAGPDADDADPGEDEQA